MRSYHDDLVMSVAIGCWVKDTALTVNQRELQYKKAFLNSMIVTNTNFDTRIAGMSGYKQDKGNAYAQAKKMKPFYWVYKG